MARTKRARVEGNGVEGRTGITRRRPYVVEIRLPKKVAYAKLQCGSYETLEEANVARDIVAFLRNWAGEEDRAAVGGFNTNVHPFIYKFKELPGVYESLGSRGHALCDKYTSFLELPTAEVCKKFCEGLREDIGVAIESFRSRYPRKLPPPLLNRLPTAEPADGEIHRTPQPSNSEVRVSPTPGREVGVSMGEGSTSFIGPSSVEVQSTVNGSPFQTLRIMNGTAEEVSRITKAGKDTMERFDRELVDELLKELGSPLIDPETIAPLDDYLLQPSTAILPPQCGAEIP